MTDANCNSGDACGEVRRQAEVGHRDVTDSPILHFATSRMASILQEKEASEAQSISFSKIPVMSVHSRCKILAPMLITTFGVYYYTAI